ncbi:MAG: hypothetical protein PHX04_04180 [Bacilli bacterium]|nr:hypothetical protein [Bacilli bacterium]
MLATDLSTTIVPDGDLGLEEVLSNLSWEKLDYIEELTEDLSALYYDNIDISQAIKKPLQVLCQYDYFRINNLIIQLAEKPEFKDDVIDTLSNIGLYYHNEELVDLVLEKGLFNNTVLNGLISAIKDVNFEAQVEFENAKYSDPLELILAQRKIEQIIATITKVVNHSGTKAFFNDINCQIEECIKDDVGLDFDDDKNQFLKDILENYAIYNLSAANLVENVEYLYGDIRHISSERVKEVRTEYTQDYNPDDDGNLATDLFNVYTRLGEYDKALEVLNDPFYELVDEEEKACLEEYGQHDMEDAKYYVDKLSTIIQILCFRKDVASINFLKEVMQHPKLTIINIESLERLYLLFTELSENDPEVWQTFNQISSYIKERIQYNNLMTYVAIEKFDNRSFGGLRIATDEEIENAVSVLGPETPFVKKLEPPKKDVSKED